MNNPTFFDNTDVDCMDILVYGTDFDLTQLYQEVWE